MKIKLHLITHVKYYELYLFNSREVAILKEYKELQNNTLAVEKRYTAKIQQLEKVLKLKTDQLILALKDKG